MSGSPDAASSALECLRAVLAIARRQAEALETDALDRFELLLDERAALLAKLEALEITSAAAVRGSPEARTLEATAREIIEQDRRNQAVLGDRLGQVRTELPILAASSRVAGAYRVPANNAPTYVDRSS